MTSERVAYKLDQLGFVGRGRSRHRPRNDPTLYGGKYPFFQTGDVKSAEFYLGNYSATYSEKGLAQSKLWKPGTLCVTIAANIAETAVLKIPGCFPDSVVGFVADPDKSDTAFVKYYLETLKMSMQGVSQGTTQDNLSLDKLLSFDFLVPPVAEQKKIASVLLAYDDLIENNACRIEILEEMARRLYEEWFVHFRFPGHDEVNFTESELGRIPDGWGIADVKSLVSRQKNGRVYKQDEASDEGAVVIIDQSRAEFLGYHSNVPDHNASSKLPIIIFGDHTCKMQIMGSPFSLGPNTIAFTTAAQHSVYYLFSLVRGLIKTQEYKRHWGDFMKKRVVVAPVDVSIEFGCAVEPMFQMIELLRHKIRNLRAQRDLLLPKLVSGEIDVSDIPMPDDKEVEAA